MSGRCSSLLYALALLAVSVSRGLCGPVVEPNVRVGSDARATRTYDGPGIAVNPNDPNAVALGDVDLQSGRCLLHLSADGGRTWADAPSPEDARYPFCGAQNGELFDSAAAVSLAYDAAGTLYYAYAAAQPDDGYSFSILLARSSDAGKTFTTKVVHRGLPSNDYLKADVNFLPSVVVDDSGPALHHVYVAWSRTFAFDLKKANIGYVAASADGGATFDAPVALPMPARVVSLAVFRGTLYAVFGESLAVRRVLPPRLYVATSTDRGKTFGLKEIFAGAPRSSSPSVAVDPKTGALVAAWYDNHLAKPGVIFDGVFTARSLDGGATWSKPLPVSPVTPVKGRNSNQLYPVVRAAANGRIDVVWYDYRHDTVPLPTTPPLSYLGEFADVYAASSFDDGKAFLPAVKLNDRLIDRRLGTWNAQYFFLGPPGLASTNEALFAAWPDTRNGNPDNQAQDTYATQEYFEPPPAEVSGLRNPASAWPLWLGLLLAALGIGLFAGGLALMRRRLSA